MLKEKHGAVCLVFLVKIVLHLLDSLVEEETDKKFICILCPYLL